MFDAQRKSIAEWIADLFRRRKPDPEPPPIAAPAAVSTAYAARALRYSTAGFIPDPFPFKDS